MTQTLKPPFLRLGDCFEIEDTDLGSITFKLSAAEQAELAKAVNGQGGYQTLLRELKPQIQPNGDLTLDDEQLGRVIRMCAYGSGGFQGRLRSAFKNHVKGLMTW